MDKVDIILDKITEMLDLLGFERVSVNGETNFVYGDTYCVPNYVENGIGFLMEYAHSEEDARKNFHGDSDSFPLKLGEKAILAGIMGDLFLNIPELSASAKMTPVRVSA